MISITNGVDLVDIERFENLNPAIKERFLKRVFTVSELAETGKAFQHLAGKFAAKEAAAKALGCGIGPVSWQDLEILNDADGRPQLFLHGPAKITAENTGWFSWSISISHTKFNAVAVVNALMEKP